ncbi:MAG TPA: cytochrome b [Candidatus Competibacter sp.]|nr:cytochrome b [Candidatus Competibacter sp.]
MEKVTATRYSGVAIGLHWLMTVLIVAAFGLGWTLSGMEFSPQKLRWIAWHKWLGVTVLGLAALRLAWRSTHAAPPLPATMPIWQQWAAHAVHVLLYGLMFAIPLSGWLFSSAKGISVVYLGILPLPDLIGADERLADWLRALHAWLNYALLGVVAAHAGAALKHHFIERDDVLVRMLPLLGRREK